MKEGIVSTEDTAKAVGGTQTDPEQLQAAETKPEDAETMDTAFGEKAAAEPTGQTAGIDWASHGFPDLVGKSPDEVKNYFQFTNRRYGAQANELGQLRKQVEEYEKLKQQIAGQKPKPEKATEELSEVEMALFANKFNENPLAAMREFLLPKMTESLRDQILSHVKEEFGPVLEGQAQNLAKEQEFTAFVKENPDYLQYQDVMKQLMTPDYIGEDAPFEEVYKLAKLTKEEPSLFPNICGLMRRGIPFDEAKDYASLKQNASASADAKREQIKKEVASIAVGTKRTAAKQVTSEPEIKTMDDAFAL